MKRKISVLLFLIFFFGVSSYASTVFSAGTSGGEKGILWQAVQQAVSGKTDKALLPNRGGKSLSIPTAWGASAYTVFAGAGATIPAAWSDSNDGGAGFGIGLGNPIKYLGVQVSSSINDLSDIDNFSWGFKAHRYIGYGTSVAGGGLNLFADQESDADETYYGVISHAVQQLPSLYDPNKSMLHINIGGGGGHFAEKSDRDKSEGKVRDGTGVFGSVALEVYKSVNAVVEWNGNNLAIGFSAAPFGDMPIGITVGLADILRGKQVSGDGERLIIATGFAYSF